VTVYELYDALHDNERTLPIEAVTGWECGSSTMVAAAIVAPLFHVNTGTELRPTCVLILAGPIANEVVTIDGSVVQRVVIAGPSEG
jgi:hypothetical protein